MKKLELWAGLECTVNRVGDAYRDQVVLTGHESREGDEERIASLGATTVRYPILWERTAPDGLARADWRWADARVQAFRDRGLRIIAGLVHHGSGPRGTSLLDPGFVEGLAAFAGAVAARYPFITDFTPVNEPLTTARFSALYGHWYPHRRDTASFLRALMVEVEATRAAMDAIRRHTPAARLVQTEDIGHTSSTPALAYQAEYENARRWLSLDLLAGRVDRDHPLCVHLLEHGVHCAALRSLVARPCTPDLIGVNYYVTSDRFLDDRLELHPSELPGGNGRHRYVDVEAVRADAEGIVGHARVLEEVAGRYGRPVAITESHLGCAPEEQIRWLRESWDGALHARARGASVEAVTLWSTFGAFDWDSLVTRERGHYEPGAFDVRGPEPRPTALARVARELATTGQSTHPLAEAPGWWRRADRFLPWVGRRAARPVESVAPVLVLGDEDVAATVRAACARRGFDGRVVTGATPRMAASVIEAARPWLVIDAMSTWAPGLPEDRLGTHEAVARACALVGARFVLLSSAHVFRGDKLSAYVEDDPVDPSCARGREQALVERRVHEIVDDVVLVRAGLLFGGRRRGAAALDVRRPDDWDPSTLVSLTHLPELVHRCLDLAVDGASGTWHLAHEGSRTLAGWLARAEQARASHRGPSSSAVRAAPPLPSSPPQRGLRSAKWSPLSSFDAAIDRHVTETPRGAEGSFVTADS